MVEDFEGHHAEALRSSLAITEVSLGVASREVMHKSMVDVDEKERVRTDRGWRSRGR